MKAETSKNDPKRLGEVVELLLRMEGDVSGVESRSMRSGEAIVGGMVVGRVKDSMNGFACLLMMGEMLCYKFEEPMSCAAHSQVSA